jgi:hypothetical protein
MMKRALKDKPQKKTYPISGAGKKEIMENPVERNSKNLSGVPESTKATQEKARARLAEEIEKMIKGW